jgi:hypothetical protein
MESLYYVMCWACHRKCRHCYEDRFRPYVRGALDAVVAEARANFPSIVDHLPERMTYLDLNAPLGNGRFPEKIGRIVLSGGEALLDPVREQVTYPVIERLQQRYRAQGGIKVIVQTTGDLLTEAIVDDLLKRGIYMFSIASVDEYHVGIDTPAKQEAFIERLSTLFERAGVRRSGLSATTRNWHEEEGPLYGFFGAAPDTWIGKIWPRGRAWKNGLSTATIADDFCNRWSGGLGFLNHGYSGSEVSIEPDGAVYPCCVKTRLPIGNLLEEPLLEILDSLAGEPAYEAINAGHPERMGIAHGWSMATFLAKSRTLTPAGQPYQNACGHCASASQRQTGAASDAACSRTRSRRPSPSPGRADDPANGRHHHCSRSDEITPPAIA